MRATHCFKKIFFLLLDKISNLLACQGDVMKWADLARIDELDQGILNLSSRINAATYELLVMIREFDEPAGLPLESVKRLYCDGQAVVITEDGDGGPLSIARKSRIGPAAIARAVRAAERPPPLYRLENRH
jgi:hypothetical protein